MTILLRDENLDVAQIKEDTARYTVMEKDAAKNQGYIAAHVLFIRRYITVMELPE